VVSALTDARLIGRAAELAALEAALADAAEGHPALAFVAGESGVGKTRLLAELESRAGDARVLRGDCVELAEGELPYAPLVGALRPLVREDDPALAALPEAARTELATLLPEIGTPAAPRPADEERGAAQRRLFEALLGLLDSLGREAPVLLVLEDIHWADRSTRAFLAFLGRSLLDERVLAVTSYRSDEMHRRHPLRPLLAELERSPRARRVALEPLTRAELEAHLEDIAGEAPSPELVDRLFARSQGNPLYAEELFAAGSDGRGGLPPTLRDALMLRVERLSGPAQDVLRVLAAARLADHALLEEAGGLDPRELREAVREAVTGNIVVVDSEQRYEFRHALLREVVYDDLLPGERADLHLALARALERRAQQDGGGALRSAAIAHHYRAGGDQPAELRAAVRAAAEAERVRAHGEAAAMLERALDLWSRVPDPAAAVGSDRVGLLRRAAFAHHLNGDEDRCLPLLERALAELDEASDPSRAAMLLGDLSLILWALGRGEQSRDRLRTALALLPDDDTTTERARLLTLRARMLMLQGRYREALEASEAAMEAAAAVGDEGARGRILSRQGVALVQLGQVEEGKAALREAIEVSRRDAGFDDLSTAFVNFADAFHLAGRSRQALEVICEGMREIGGEDRSARWMAAAAAEFEFELGEWASAAARLPARRGAGSGTVLVNEHLRRAELALGRGDTESVRPLLDECEALLRTSLEPQYIAATGALRAELERRTGALDAARAAVEDALDRIEYCSEDLARLATVAGAGVTVEADAAERERDLHDPAAEQAAIQRAEIMLERVRAAALDGGPVEQARLVAAEAEAARAAGRSEPAAWAAAAAAWDGIERPYSAALARRREAEAHVVVGDREAAAATVSAALEAARELGSNWLVAELESLAARARLQPAASHEPAAAAAPSDEDPFGLTPRERQVLTLLARGATNKAIGAELYMAEKTASVHVSRILSKLDVRTRTEAAAVAHRHGLAG
jgi:DNA-binding CsgD family transcriptional regulator/tetratricopeptide (TPR) repeat protein